MNTGETAAENGHYQTYKHTDTLLLESIIANRSVHLVESTKSLQFPSSVAVYVTKLFHCNEYH